MFSLSPGIGPIRFSELINLYKDSKKAWTECSLLDFQKIGLGQRSYEAFADFRKSNNLDQFLEKLNKLFVDFLCRHEKEYPKELLKLSDPPIVIYLRGNKSLLTQDPKIAIVGARKTTSYGRQVTEQISSTLASNGVVVVSGMAMGVDGVAHKASLDANGATIAVLGSGIDIAYPRENAVLYERILKENSLIISEYPPGTQASKGTFPARNRIIASISKATIVTEAARDSGSLITAEIAKSLSKKVFAVPGMVNSLMSQGSLKLLKEGAQMATNGEDVLSYIGKKVGIEKQIDLSKFAKDERKVLEALQIEEMNIDMLSRSLKIDTRALSILLSSLELRGMIKQSGGKYSFREVKSDARAHHFDKI